MASNIQVESCIRAERGALLFCSPKNKQHRVGGKVQIIDVFALQVVTGYCRDPQGRLLLKAEPSLAAGWHLKLINMLGVYFGPVVGCNIAVSY